MSNFETGGKIAIVGGGAWGTALGHMLCRDGRRVLLYARDPETVRAINDRHENPRYLPGIPLAGELEATTDLAIALNGAGAILLVTPAQTLAAVAGQMLAATPAGVPVIVCAKGIERDTGRFPSRIVAEALYSSPIAVLSGPSFAADVARGLPTAVTVAANDSALAARLAGHLSTHAFRCYSTDDLAGVEIGAALKNVLAIAAGASAGAGLGASAQAAIVTRGFVELRRIAAAFGARPETLMGLSGLGDLVLTCNSPQSRNFSYGFALGRGENLEGRLLAEGVVTTGIASRLATDKKVDAPIIAAIDRLLKKQTTISEAVAALLARPLKSEDQ